MMRWTDSPDWWRVDWEGQGYREPPPATTRQARYVAYLTKRLLLAARQPLVYVRGFGEVAPGDIDELVDWVRGMNIAEASELIERLLDEG